MTLFEFIQKHQDKEEMKMKMDFKLHTYDIQSLVIALICYKDTDGVLTKEDSKRLEDKLMELNNLCNKENDYTLHITVES